LHPCPAHHGGRPIRAGVQHHRDLHCFSKQRGVSRSTVKSSQTTWQQRLFVVGRNHHANHVDASADDLIFLSLIVIHLLIVLLGAA
jgi:hypothetical protein